MIRQIELKCPVCRQKFYSPRQDALHAKCLITLPIVAQVSEQSPTPYQRITEPEGVSVAESHPYVPNEVDAEKIKKNPNGISQLVQVVKVDVAEFDKAVDALSEVIQITVPEKKLKKITDLKATKKLEYNRRRNAALRRIAKESLGN